MKICVNENIEKFDFGEVKLIVKKENDFPMMEKAVKLSDVGLLIWNYIENRPGVSLENVVSMLIKKFPNVSTEVLKYDASAFLDNLKELEVIYYM